MKSKYQEPAPNIHGFGNGSGIESQMLDLFSVLPHDPIGLPFREIYVSPDFNFVSSFYGIVESENLQTT